MSRSDGEGASLTAPPAWDAPSGDPNDEQFGDVIEPATIAEADGYEAVLVGVPYDGGVISRPGAAEGPDAVRASLAATKTHHFDAGPVDGVADLGNVAVPEGSVSTAQSAIRAVAERVHSCDALPVFLGGDNATTYADAAPLLSGSVPESESGSVGALSFDAHLDCREVRGEPTSGSPYRQLFEAGLDSYACVGARHFETSSAYHDYVHDRDGAVVPAETVGDDPVAAVDRALDRLSGVESLYVSVDMDVLDAPYDGVSAPTPGGITPRELFRMVRLVAADDRVAGFEVVETAPPLDSGGRTVDAAARTVAHFLAGWGV